MIEKCDICKSKIENKFIEGLTIQGQWAVMCPTCHQVYGQGPSQFYQNTKSLIILRKTNDQ